MKYKYKFLNHLQLILPKFLKEDYSPYQCRVSANRENYNLRARRIHLQNMLKTLINTGKNAFGISAGRYFFGGYSEVDTSRAKEWNPKVQYSIDGYYALTIKDWKGKISASYFDEELRDNGNLNPDLNYEGAFDYYHFTNRWDTKIDLNKKLGDKQNLQHRRYLQG